MKRVIIFTLLLNYWFLTTYSLDDDSREIVKQIDTGRKSICYQFGLQNVYIIEGDSICEVVIKSDKSDKYISTTCKTTPILEWAFNNSSEELAHAQFTIDDNYHWISSKLSLQEDSCQTIIDSSSMCITGNKKLAAKINELKKFIIDFWVKNYLETFKDN